MSHQKYSLIGSFWVSLFVLMVFSQCTEKKYIVEVDHRVDTTDQNEPPPFNKPTEAQLNHYIQKYHIDLIGREPSQSELTDHSTQIKAADYSKSAIEGLLRGMLYKEAWGAHVFEVYSSAYLGGASIQFIQEQVANLGVAYNLLMYSRVEFLKQSWSK